MATDPAPSRHPSVVDFDRALRNALEEHAVAFPASRSLALKREAVRAFASLEELAVRLKRVAAADGDENAAARLLMGECFADGVKTRLNMWIAFREGDMEQAWSCLIHAQRCFECAVRAHPSGNQFKESLTELHVLEESLFPKQVFLSTGWITRRSECTLCGASFGSCEHIRGRVYGGEFASRITTEADPVEVSIVDLPEDKMCRIYEITSEDVRRSTLTWEAASEEPTS